MDRADSLTGNEASQNQFEAFLSRESTFHLSRNQVIQDVFTSNIYRILYIPVTEDKDAVGYWIQLNSTTNIPKSFVCSDLLEKLAIGTLELVADAYTVRDDSSLNVKAIQRRDRAWNLIHHIIGQEPEIYIYEERSRLLKAVEQASGVKTNNLYSYLGKYWKSGFQLNSLAPNYQNCGGARTARSLDNIVGRHKKEGNNGKVLTDEDFKFFALAIEKYYQKSTKTSLRETYRKMLAEYYVRPRFEGDPNPVTMGADEKPSFGQFYYWHHNHGNLVEDTMAREGVHNFDLKYRAIIGKTATNLFGPGVSIQIDATIGDFYLTKKLDRSAIVGRPIIVIIKDAWARKILGFAIELTNSSCDVWKAALLSMVTSKVEICKKYGIEIKDEEWPAYPLPFSITTDNGEFAVKEINDIVQKLGITVENCPPYRGDLKGIIERAIGVHQMQLKSYIPGYVDKDAGERGAEDYRKNACVDYDTFVAIFIKIFLYYNNYHYLNPQYYERTEDMREKGVPAIPRYLWEYGISHMTGAMRILDPEDYLDALLKKGTATVTESGIRHNGLYYTCQEAVTEKWMEQARINGAYDLPALYNPFSCENLYIRKSDGKLLTCVLVNAYAQYSGYTDEDRQKAHELDLKDQAAHQQEADQAYSDLYRFIESNVERCQNEGKNQGKIKGILNKHNIRKNREEEQKEVTGEAAARREQEKMGYNTATDNSSDSKVQAAGNNNNAEKPKSYETVSGSIDAILANLGVGSVEDN